MILAASPLLTTVLPVSAAVGYAAMALAQRRLDASGSRLGLTLAWLLHGAVLASQLLTPPPSFGFGPALSITAWLVLMVYAIESHIYPQLKANAMLLVLGMVTVLLAWAFPGAPYPSMPSPWLPLHWALGIAAYGLIAAGRANFKLSESRNAMNAIKRYASEDAHIIYGTAYDESLGDALRVTVIATGLTAGRARQQAPLQVVQTQQVVRNGTDGMPVLTQAVAMTAPATGPQANVGLGLGDFANANVPSVWRHGRSGSAAAKVEALSSNGMDEIEIPAFLRKQAD